MINWTAFTDFKVLFKNIYIFHKEKQTRFLWYTVIHHWEGKIGQLSSQNLDNIDCKTSRIYIFFKLNKPFFPKTKIHV